MAIANVALGPLSGDSYFTGVLQTDNALLVGRAQYLQNPLTSVTAPAFQRRLYGYDIIDVRNPAAPVLASRFEVPEAIATSGWAWPPHTGMPYTAYSSTRANWLGGDASSGELSVGSVVVSQHAEPFEGDATRVKFYMDRLDVSDPSAPRLLPSINIPGSILSYNPVDGELITFGYRQQRHDASSAEECVTLGDTTRSFDGTACLFKQPSLNALALEGDRVVRQNEVLIDPTLRLHALSVSESRVLLMASASAGYLAPSTIMLRSFRVEAGQLVELPAQELRHSRGDDGRFRSDFQARGDRAVSLFDNVLTVVDTSDPSAPARLVRALPHSSCFGFDVTDDALYCPAGSSGVEVIDLRTMP